MPPRRRFAKQPFPAAPRDVDFELVDDRVGLEGSLTRVSQAKRYGVDDEDDGDGDVEPEGWTIPEWE